MNKAFNKCGAGDLNEISFVEILTEYSPLVKSRALFFLSNSCEFDDLIQEGTIGLLSAFHKYDEKLSGFATFARRCIDASIIDYLRKSSKLSQVPENMLVDISDIQIADSSLDPVNTVALKDEYTGIVNKANEVLSSLELTVFKALTSGLTRDEIANKNKMSVKSVDNAIQRIRTKLK